MKSSRQGSVTSRTSSTSTLRHPQGSTTNPSPEKRSPLKAEKAPCLSRGNSPALKIPVNKKKNLPLHRETKKTGPYIFDPDTVESISTENINPFPSTRISEKDLDARLQLGELKLSSLDNRITQCLENSRKVLAVTESFCRPTSDVIASERILPANSELILSYSKSKNQSKEEIVDQGQADEAQKKAEPVTNINLPEDKQTEGIQLARSKSCSIVSQELPLDVIKDKLENFAQKGFLSTKNKRQEKLINLKQRDLSFKDLMNTISPSIRKIKLLMPLEYERFEEKVNSLQTIGLFSPKEFDVQSMASIKEETAKEDLNKFLKQSGQMTNSSNLEELRDFLSLLHNIDAKTGRHSDTSNLSYFDMKESTHHHLNDQKGNNILQIEEIQLEEDKETRPSIENRNSKSPQAKEQAPKRIKNSNSDKAIKLLAVKQEETINQLLVQPETYTPREIKPKSPGQLRFEMTDPKNTPRVRTSPRKVASSRKELPKSQEMNSKSQTTRDKIKSPVRHSSDSRSPQKTREQSKDTEPSRPNSRSAREKKPEKLEKKNPKEETPRESPDEAAKNMMKRKKEAVQNLIAKFVKDSERRKESLERARAAKDEKEKQTLSLMNQVFTNKNNKSESKVRQYICRSRGRIEPNDGSETQRVEKTSFMQDKRPKKVSFSIEKSPSRIIQREASNISQQKSNKEPITSAIAKDLKEIEKVCMKENKELDLDYLRGLRSDIEKIKENIEEKIQGIEKANTSRGTSEKHITKSILKKSETGLAKGSKSTNHSLERLNERSQKSRVKTRFQNSSSRILEYMGAKTEKASSSRIEPGKMFEPASINSLNLNQLTRTSSSTRNFRAKDQLTPRKWFNNDLKEKQASQTKSTFMDDVRAMNYVNQLISDFKDIQGLKSPRKK